ncbi:AtuA-related protein [Gryllotalpicola koreensis]|uniref:AtuA-like ferredoxin-fold domain-containing protein n=1 Tax=Gryllotalpicola koreensis TaxID=993086 RepID=A0ABP7ZQP3_9MICO
MIAPLRLGDFCVARAGDKGDSSILMLAPTDPARLPDVVASVTPEVIAGHFNLDVSHVRLHPSPGLGALTIMLRGRLGGGVTRSGWAEPHGKTLSAHLLDLKLSGEPADGRIPKETSHDLE